MPPHDGKTIKYGKKSPPKSVITLIILPLDFRYNPEKNPLPLVGKN